MRNLRMLMLAGAAWLTGCRLATMPVIPTPRPSPLPPTVTPTPVPTATPTPAPTATPVPVIRARAPAAVDAEAALYGRVAAAAGAKTSFERGNASLDAYLDTLKVELLAGSGPDVFWIPGRELAEFQRRGWLLDLRPFAQADGVTDGVFRAEAMAHLTFDPKTAARGGALWGLPREIQPQVLYVNQALSKSAPGPDPRELASQGRWTWQALRDAARRASDVRAGRYGFAMQPEWTAVAAWAAGAGGDAMNAARSACAFTDDAAWRGVEFLAQLYGDQAALPASESAVDAWLGGKVLFLQSDARFLARARASGLVFDVIALPAGPARPTGYAGWGAWVVNARTRFAPLAWALARRLVATDVQREAASLGVPPARIDAADAFVNAAGVPGAVVMAAMGTGGPSEAPVWGGSAAGWNAAANAQFAGLFGPKPDTAAARVSLCKVIDMAAFGR